MTGVRFLAASVLAAACALLGLALLVDRFVSPVGDSMLGTTGLVLALALIAAALFVRPVGSRFLPLFGILPALIVALYASWLLDPEPTDLPERDNLLFAIGLTFLWILETVLRFERSTRIGVVGSLLLFLAVVVDVGSMPPGTAVRPTSPAIVVGALGLILVATWAARLAAWIRTSGPLVVEAMNVGPPAPALLAWQWARPIPDGVARLVTLAGLAAAIGGVLRLATGGDIGQPVLAGAHAAFGVLWAIAVVRIVRAAPKVGQVTSVVVALADLAVPLGLVVPAVTGGLALVAPLIGADLDRAGSDARLAPAELASAALLVIGISVARLARVVRAGTRSIGLLAGLGLIVGGSAFLNGAATGNEDVASVGRTVLALAWLLGGLWVIVLGRRLRGAVPLAVFHPPSGRVGVADPPVRRREHRSGRLVRPGASAHSRRRASFAREPRTAARHDLAELARRLGVPAADLRAFRPVYTTFRIPKRSGGERTITAPIAATKALQRRILRRLLDRLPAHPAAQGFERGRSIVTNAAVHQDPAVLVKLDVEDFFGTTRTARIRRYWRVIGWDREAAAVLTRLTTHVGGLPQGAPTSPRLSNLVNVRLDARLAGIARSRGAVYTRYADDLSFSFTADDGAAVRQLIHAVRRTVWAEGRYRIHVNRKVEIRRRHERQAITGLIVNEGPPRLDRERRRWLRAVEHRRYSGGRPTIDDDALRGWQALEAMIENQATAAPARPSVAAPNDLHDDRDEEDPAFQDGDEHDRA